uniref:NADH dehydrogenase [ubiquinone] 1 alpha subcomplex subunit 11 n=1 Tax=Hippocampus comes TaxID=109280 RepID=A0A3Q2XE42_HIPCM
MGGRRDGPTSARFDRCCRRSRGAASRIGTCSSKVRTWTRASSALAHFVPLWRTLMSALCVSPAAMGAIFGMATCLSAQARQAPDDPLNYFAGGCASGIFLGARSKWGRAAGALLFTDAILARGRRPGWRLIGPPKL